METWKRTICKYDKSSFANNNVIKGIAFHFLIQIQHLIKSSSAKKAKLTTKFVNSLENQVFEQVTNKSI